MKIIAIIMAIAMVLFMFAPLAVHYDDKYAAPYAPAYDLCLPPEELKMFQTEEWIMPKRNPKDDN